MKPDHLQALRDLLLLSRPIRRFSTGSQLPGPAIETLRAFSDDELKAADDVLARLRFPESDGDRFCKSTVIAGNHFCGPVPRPPVYLRPPSHLLSQPHPPRYTFLETHPDKSSGSTASQVRSPRHWPSHKQAVGTPSTKYVSSSVHRE